MALKIFISSILLVSSVLYFMPINKEIKAKEETDMILFVFENPIMYTLDENSFTRSLLAQKVIRYKSKDEMYFGDFVLNNTDLRKAFKKERIKADLIVKKGDIYSLTNNVEYERDNFIKLSSEHLVYDSFKKIISNNKPFKASYYNHKYLGENIHFEMENDIISSKKAHFEIEVNKK